MLWNESHWTLVVPNNNILFQSFWNPAECMWSISSIDWVLVEWISACASLLSAIDWIKWKEKIQRKLCGFSDKSILRRMIFIIYQTHPIFLPTEKLCLSLFFFIRDDFFSINPNVNIRTRTHTRRVNYYTKKIHRYII